MKPLRPLFLSSLFSLIATPWIRIEAQSIPENAVPTVIVSTEKEPGAPGPFAPTWDSLRNYLVPDWFRDAKFGIWSHWGPQCQPEQGDWYARFMYLAKPLPWASDDYGFHCRTYGHPSVFGFKDIIHTWRAERWDP